MRSLAGITAIAVSASGCHVTSEIASRRPGAVEHVRHADRATPLAPTVTLAPDGRLRFVTPLSCPTELVTEQVDVTELQTGPNLATFVVGIIVSSAGAIATANGALGGSGVSLGLGAAGLAVGLPLAIGPHLGARTELRVGPPVPPLRTAGPAEPCGDRPLAARAATLTINGLEVYGALDADGAFAISPFVLLDAYAVSHIAAWNVHAVLEGGDGPLAIDAVIAPGALAQAAPGFLARADFDAAVPAFRAVPGVQASTPRVSLAATAAGPALRLVLGVHNAGPGDAFGLRAHVVSSSPAIDGRVLYVGHVARNADATRELLIPLSAAAAAALRGATVDVAIELQDAYGSTPDAAIRYHGALLNDAPR